MGLIRQTTAGPWLLFLGLVLGCAPSSPSQSPEASAGKPDREAATNPAGGVGHGTDAADEADAGEPPFVETAAERGLVFSHWNGMTGQHNIVEEMGSGAALFDADGDGDLDVYLVQGNLFEPGRDEAQAVFPPPAPLPLTDRFFRNELIDSTGRVTHVARFTDRTEEAGLRETGYGMGVATGDFDGDGDVDLYVTQFGPNRLLRNRGDGTFEETAASAGVAGDDFSVAASFFDLDRDGWLDLYVGNYVNIDLERMPRCRATTGEPDYCGPDSFVPAADRLYRNRGDGTFEEISRASGLGTAPARSLGVLAADFDLDGWTDLYVANDGQPNQLWVNRGDGTFEDQALLLGLALGADGKAEASMGIDAGDVDGDGDFDLFLSHFMTETNTLYRAEGAIGFDDVTVAAGLALPSLPFTSFGTGFLDLENDGDVDLVVLNGSVNRIEALARAGDPYPLHQHDQLFRNRGDGTFEDLTPTAGAAFETSRVSRGAALGDLDNDGDVDVVAVDNSGAARLLENRWGDASRWLGVELLEGSPGRSPAGAAVELVLTDGRRLVRRVGTDGSYASARDPRVTFGLGADGTAERVVARWSDGSMEEWNAPPLARYTTLRRGTGRALPPASP